MAVDFGGVKMQNPINTAAGTFGYGWQFQNFFDVSQLGAITTKGCAAEPWPGNPAPRMAEIPGGMINSVGLQNPGVAAFARESGPWLEQLSKDGCQVICQVAGHSVDEFVRALEMYVELCPWAAGYEINVSCPNVHGGGMAFGASPEMAAKVTKAVKAVAKKPVYMKLSPNAADIAEVARACEEAGADGLSLINTLLGMRIDLKRRRPVLANVMGGYSGPGVFPVAVRMVYQVTGAVSIPVIGMGGVSSAQDVIEMMMAGAKAVQVGAANLTDPYACKKIIDDLPREMERLGIERLSDIQRV